MDYIAEIEHQIEFMCNINKTVMSSDISTAIAIMAEKAFYLSERASGKKPDYMLSGAKASK
jgi:hypothetical protein